ncbi:precorrin-6y C5,15-methyltransferase (decarboxylating) subunit CbiE [Psychromonas sp. SA13A]|uniref:precorrin-6y C5,15-methyltransferase (decarboxylating) subunit CbiE n=1 Tax=Psychromonas sp. SA13A TaxID=2686346 RepID=UPI001F0EB5FA|nr:precorrin-6y C5,15-methyltransferase (decarboxylating) subunit CbiE [Psychromonas sp. SA13A]
MKFFKKLMNVFSVKLADSAKASNKPTREIAVIGLGVTENAMLSEQALLALQSADLVIGSERQLLTLEKQLAFQPKVEALTEGEQQQVEPKAEVLPPRTEIIPKLKQLKALIETEQKVVVLGSGDPLYYGIGTWISKNFHDAAVRFFPAVSSITQACHSLSIAQQDVNVVSLHGRPLAKLKVELKAQQTLLLLTDKDSMPQHIAAICEQTGFTQAEIIVCERLGYSQQKISRFSVSELLTAESEGNLQTFDALHVSFVICGANKGYLPEFPGIKDTDFETGELGSKGMISKREVRLAILSLLQPSKNDIIWDIGAGCGGVAVELAYWQPQAKIYAIEHNQARFDCLLQNQQKFGVVNNLSTQFGRAPEVLSKPPFSEQPAAKKIFIGGSDGALPMLLETLWDKLPEGGQIVVSAVMERTKSQLFDFYSIRDKVADSELETLQVAVNKSRTLGGQLAYKPALSVSLFSFTKNTQQNQEKEQ